MKAVTSAITWAVIAGLVLVGLPIMAVVWLFDRTPARLVTGRTFRRIGSVATRLNSAWDVEIGGLDPSVLRHPYVAVSNHQSLADIPSISLLPWEMKWVGKKELFDIPLFGWMMKLAADIPVDRRDPDSRAAVMRAAGKKLADGASVMFFPEGTRSKDGRVKRFYDGAFRLAIEAGVPVLPLAIDGTMNAIPKHGWQFGRADVRLDVLPPVPTDGLTLDDVPALRDRVRQSIIDHVAGWREVPSESADALHGEDPQALDAADASAAVLPLAVPTPADGVRQPGPVEDRAKSLPAAPRPPAALDLGARGAIDCPRSRPAARRCPIAQLAERQFLDLEVQGSIPCRAAQDGPEHQSSRGRFFSRGPQPPPDWWRPCARSLCPLGIPAPADRRR